MPQSRTYRARRYRAETLTDVCPDLVDEKTYGHHESFVVVPGVRRWSFESREGRDAFVLAEQAGAFRRPARATRFKSRTGEAVA